jgi:hypothetical protein
LDNSTGTAILKTEHDINGLIDCGISSSDVSDKSSTLLLLALGKGLLNAVHGEAV